MSESWRHSKNGDPIVKPAAGLRSNGTEVRLYRPTADMTTLKRSFFFIIICS
jgi:hypothetical protein